MIEYKKFRVGDILTWQKKIQIRPLDIPSLTIEDGELYPFVGQSSANNAIVGFLRVDHRYLNNVESEPCIIASSNTQEFSYVDTPFFLKEAGGSMSYMKNENLNLYNSLYLITVLKKELKSRYAYGIKATNVRIRESVIQLPVKDATSAEPHWEYMEKYVKRIEEKYVERIDGCFHRLGFGNYEDVLLQDYDEYILNKHANSNFSTFKLEELFDTIKRGKRITSFDRIPGNLPFITAGVEKMGLSDFISNPEVEVFPENSLTIDMFGNTFYRNYKYGADDHVAVLYNSTTEYSKKVLLYIQPNINKSIAGKFSYSRNFYASDAPEVEIKLPVDESGNINMKLMEDYISVIEKKVVRNLRKNIDERIGGKVSLQVR
ncbi:restriction endonuclease subunit S [Paenibacillus lupini]|uniref:restriction endonuclease subunit S n=1 Tax=Paenibacillus lupini TaxID=1450204 RepID=UPI001423A7FF|nr:restriction endonuclease subunit S [Paenibacillus lupini]NIK24986.1 hypothetical protein [Paenibacillus lupini]